MRNLHTTFEKLRNLRKINYSEIDSDDLMNNQVDAEIDSDNLLNNQVDAKLGI